MIIVGGSSSRDLAKELASVLGCTYIQAASTRFPDGECYTRIDSEKLDDDVVIVQNTYPNDNLIEMFLLQDAVHRMGAKSVPLPFMRPRCTLRYFTLLGINISRCLLP